MGHDLGLLFGYSEAFQRGVGGLQEINWRCRYETVAGCTTSKHSNEIHKTCLHFLCQPSVVLRQSCICHSRPSTQYCLGALERPGTSVPGKHLVTHSRG